MSINTQLDGFLTPHENYIVRTAEEVKNLGRCGTVGTYAPIPNDRRPEVLRGDRLADKLISEREYVRRVLVGVNVVRIPNDQEQIYGRPFVVSAADPNLVWVLDS